MQRTSDHREARLDVRDRLDVTELLARIAAERGEPVDDGRDDGPQTGVTELIARINAERGEADDEPVAGAYLPDGDDLSLVAATATAELLVAQLLTLEGDAAVGSLEQAEQTLHARGAYVT